MNIGLTPRRQRRLSRDGKIKLEPLQVRTPDFKFGKVSLDFDKFGTLHRQRQQAIAQAKVDKIFAKEAKRQKNAQAKLFMEKALYLALFHDRLICVLMTARIQKQKEDSVNHAQTVLASWFRKLRAQRRFRVIAALSRIQSLAFGIKSHLRQRRIAIRRIRIFFTETKNMHQLMVARRRICLSVRRLQQGFRDFQAATEARLQALDLIWQRAALEYRKEKILAMKKQAEKTETTHDNLIHQDQLLSSSHRRERQRNWRKRRQELRWLAQHKLQAQKHEIYRGTADRAWARIEAKMHQLRHRKDSYIIIHPPKQNTIHPLLVPDHAKHQLLTDLLSTIRSKHRQRWCQQFDRIRYREAPRQYSTAEAKRILQIKYPAAQPTPVRKTERAMKEWPLMPFFLQQDDSTQLHVSLLQLVRALYDQAVTEFAPVVDTEVNERLYIKEECAMPQSSKNDTQRLLLKEAATTERSRTRRNSV